MLFETHSEIETWEVAKRFALTLAPGDVVCLEGDLGAGKTTFTQGLCAALGARRTVTSPTFCIVSEHPAERFLVVHMDLYRLHDEDKAVADWYKEMAAAHLAFNENGHKNVMRLIEHARATSADNPMMPGMMAVYNEIHADLKREAAEVQAMIQNYK